VPLLLLLLLPLLLLLLLLFGAMPALLVLLLLGEGVPLVPLGIAVIGSITSSSICCCNTPPCCAGAGCCWGCNPSTPFQGLAQQLRGQLCSLLPSGCPWEASMCELQEAADQGVAWQPYMALRHCRPSWTLRCRPCCPECQQGHLSHQG
jgi:hypothetical protein